MGNICSTPVPLSEIKPEDVTSDHLDEMCRHLSTKWKALKGKDISKYPCFQTQETEEREDTLSSTFGDIDNIVAGAHGEGIRKRHELEKWTTVVEEICRSLGGAPLPMSKDGDSFLQKLVWISKLINQRDLHEDGNWTLANKILKEDITNVETIVGLVDELYTKLLKRIQRNRQIQEQNTGTDIEGVHNQVVTDRRGDRRGQQRRLSHSHSEGETGLTRRLQSVMSNRPTMTSYGLTSAFSQRPDFDDLNELDKLKYEEKPEKETTPEEANEDGNVIRRRMLTSGTTATVTVGGVLAAAILFVFVGRCFRKRRPASQDTDSMA